MNDFKAEPEDLIREEVSAVERVIRSGWYVLGEEVRLFEEAWAGRCGVRRAVGVGNGMDALEIGLRALRLAPGDEVVTTPLTAFATVLAILRSGATPVLADIDSETSLLDMASVRRCLGPRTKAVLLVHLYGQVAGMDGWLSLCRENNIHLLEDCAQAHLAQWKGRSAGSFGAWGAFSFYPTKNLGTLGDGGALVTDSEAIAALAASLRNYGQSERYRHPEAGLNSRLDEIHAALLRVRLKRLDEFIHRRRAIARAFNGGIRNPAVRFLKIPADPRSHVYHLYVVVCSERDRLAAHLRERGVQTFVHYPVPVHHQEPCRALKRDPSGLSRAERHADACLSLPCHPQMTDGDVARVISAVNEFA